MNKAEVDILVVSISTVILAISSADRAPLTKEQKYAAVVAFGEIIRILGGADAVRLVEAAKEHSLASVSSELEAELFLERLQHGQD
jgi:hypothetical protein